MKKSDFKEFKPEFYKSCEIIAEQHGCRNPINIDCNSCPFKADSRTNDDDLCRNCNIESCLAKAYLILYKEESKMKKVETDYGMVSLDTVNEALRKMFAKEKPKDEYVDFSEFKNVSVPITIQHKVWGQYAYKSLFLDRKYGWEIKIDSDGYQCLMAKKKK